MWRFIRHFVALVVCLLVETAFVAGDEPTNSLPPIPLIVDTDIGSSIDDVFALAWVLAEPKFELVAVTTVAGNTDDRAWLACRFLTQCRHAGAPVAAGSAPQPEAALDWQIQYRRHPAAIFNRTLKPVKQSAVELIYEKLKARPREITIVALGPATNVARLLTEHPDAKELVKQIVWLGGSLRVGYEGQPPPVPEWNVKTDVAAARALLSSGAPLRLVTLDVTHNCRLTETARNQIFGAHTPLTFQLHNLFELADDPTIALHDVLAVAAALKPGSFEWETQSVAVDVAGRTLSKPDRTSTIQIAKSVSLDLHLAEFVHRLMTSGDAVLPQPPAHRTQLVDPGKFPRRVHVFEDYDSDIERRWWMSGKAELNDVPPDSRRACRAVLTQDFDDKQGDTKTMYRAVIFNPVPGPPIGPNTRLSFRYKLRGTDTLRIQLYSLTNGYHRYLSVVGLPRNEWRFAAVNMTDMRRPDGSGGPLAENERIDDIQFYIDPRAELLIDDVMLYDAAMDDEARPFPKRVLFTGWFDTGKQGQEWPGTFEIVPHEKPLAWKFARSVSREGTDQAWLRVSLRGDRRLARETHLGFRYRLTGADLIHVELFRKGQPLNLLCEWKAPAADVWSKKLLTFQIPSANDRDQFVDELQFVIPAGGQLSVDDLVLYEPGEIGKQKR